MRGRIRSISTHRRQPLTQGWQLCSTPAGAVEHPAALDTGIQWSSFTAPATAASALRSAGAWSLDGIPRRFDAEDWWFRLRFTALPVDGEELVLGLDGLATLVDVWLDGQPLLSSDNMFLAHERAIAPHPAERELILRCRSLDLALTTRRPRPRWKAPMIENQQLRWFRTTLLGRTPGWSPPAAPVGPWRGVWLEWRRAPTLDNTRIATSVDGSAGEVRFASDLASPLAAIERAELVLERDGVRYRQSLHPEPGTQRWSGTLRIEGVQLWWPHTHGEPALYRASVAVHLAGGDTVNADLGATGFRSLQLDRTDDGFAISVNGVRIFCRGACWTPLDAVALSSAPAACRAALEQVRAAGMNMLRVGGTMVYESDEFLDLCDQYGILLWQDFMFANMDYPQDDARFVAGVEEEVRQQLARLSGRPCLAVLCGNSEGEQQAAMWGATRDRWTPQLFHELLPSITRQLCPDVPYWPSSAHGGSFPHQANAGTTSYYGVGAYLRPLEDARRSDLRFATECLAFANVPDEACMALMPGGLALRVHHPQWKARSPRDLGAGWDFEDVRDFYLELLFAVDARQLRYADYDRYLQLSRVVTGEVMAATFGEWRRGVSRCNGALVWLLRDLWPGAGWGIIDGRGMPKAPYYYLRRALQPLSVAISDEGCSGLALHVSNEGAAEFRGSVEFTLYRDGEIPIAKARKTLTLAGNASLQLAPVEWLEGFLDASYAFRFGPPAHDLATAVLRDAGDAVVADAFHLPQGLNRPRDPALGLSAKLQARAGSFELMLHAKRFAQAVYIAIDGLTPEDNFIHLEPDRTRRVKLIVQNELKALRGTITPLNGGAIEVMAPATNSGDG